MATPSTRYFPRATSDPEAVFSAERVALAGFAPPLFAAGVWPFTLLVPNVRSVIMRQVRSPIKSCGWREERKNDEREDMNRHLRKQYVCNSILYPLR